MKSRHVSLECALFPKGSSAIRPGADKAFVFIVDSPEIQNTSKLVPDTTILTTARFETVIIIDVQIFMESYSYAGALIHFCNK